MVVNNYQRIFPQICWTLIVNLLVCSFPLTVDAQPTPTDRGKPRTEDGGTRGGEQQQTNTPRRRGKPAHREDGGTRGPSCLSGDPAILTALMPTNNLGLTTAAYPRFFWYVPQTAARKAKFSLYKVEANSQRQTIVYETTFNISGQSGIASLALPADAGMPGLEVNQDYRWSLSITCNSQPGVPRSIFTVDGWVQRVALSGDIAEQLRRLSPSDRLKVYARQDLWFDQLATLADLRACKASDQTLSDSWVQLLTAEKLPDIAQKPLLQQCSNPQ